MQVPAARVKVIGVEPEDAASMAGALAAGERIMLDQVGLFADGVAVRQAGEETFRLCRELLDEVITVSTDEICAAVKDIFEDTRAIAEPSGAVSLAGLKAYTAREAKRTGAVIAINSGANMNFDRLRHIAERAEIGEHREALLAVTIPEKPGAYRAFIELLGRRAITEFNYRYSDPKAARIFVGVQLSEGDTEKRQIIAMLSEHGYPVLDMSDNELAKLHIRYMVGGKAPGLGDELVFRFQFPERPGRTAQVPEQPLGRLEHLAVPLSQPRRRLRPHPRRHPDSAGPARPARQAARCARLPLLERERQPGLSVVPRGNADGVNNRRRMEA
jgi:threonine dehydratase